MAAAICGALALVFAVLAAVQPAGAAGDTTNPVLSSFTRQGNGTLAAPGTISVSYTATDAGGVKDVRGTYATPTGGFITSQFVAGASGTLTFPITASAAPGKYLLAAIQVRDTADPTNSVVYRRDGKITKLTAGSTGPDTHTLQFANGDVTVSNTNSDTTNPTLVGVSRQGSASVTAPTTVSVSYTASDAGAGVLDVRGSYTTPSGGVLISPAVNGPSGTLTFTIPAAAPAGSYALTAIRVRDKADPANDVVYRRNGSIQKVTPDSAGPNTHTLKFSDADFTVTGAATTTTVAPTTTTTAAPTTTTTVAGSTTTTVAGGSTTTTVPGSTTTTVAGGSTTTTVPGSTTTTVAGGSTTTTVPGSTTTTVAGGGTTTTTVAGSTTSTTVAPPSSSLALSATTVQAGQPVTVTGEGFRPGSAVDLSLHSDVVELGSATADANGRFSRSVVIPASTPAGAHTITAAGVDRNGGARNLSVTVTVTPKPAPHLPVSGSQTKRDASIALAVIALGLFAMGSRLLVEDRRLL